MKKNLIFAFLLLSSNIFGQFFTQKIISDQLPNPQGVVAYDFNGDGQIEIVYTDISGNKVNILQKNNDTYEASSILSFSKPIRLALGDFNEDDQMDIAVTSISEKGIKILRNTSNLSFNPKTVGYFDIEKSRDLVVRDFDNDGDMDIVVGSPIKDKLVMFQLTQPSTFSFSSKTISTNQDNIGEISSGDFDNDGDLDLATCTRFGKTVDVFDNNGNMNFSLSNISTAYGPIGNTVADFNNDGKPDIAVSDFNGGGVLIFKNNGSGISSTQNLIDISITHPVSIEAADFDNDGNTDIIVTYEDGLVFYRNTDPSNLTFEKNEINLGASPSDLFIIDLDKDGDLDILVTNTSANTIFEFENNHIISSTANLSKGNVKTYPNPTTSLLHIASQDPINQIQIINGIGQIISSSKHQKTIELKGIPNGIYFCKVTNSNGSISISKVIKE